MILRSPRDLHAVAAGEDGAGAARTAALGTLEPVLAALLALLLLHEPVSRSILAGLALELAGLILVASPRVRRRPRSCLEGPPAVRSCPSEFVEACISSGTRAHNA